MDTLYPTQNVFISFSPFLLLLKVPLNLFLFWHNFNCKVCKFCSCQSFAKVSIAATVVAIHYRLKVLKKSLITSLVFQIYIYIYLFPNSDDYETFLGFFPNVKQTWKLIQQKANIIFENWKDDARGIWHTVCSWNGLRLISHLEFPAE